MFVEERHEKILQLLYENGKVKVKELSERFQVTEDCIRKDLASMEGRQLLKRTYGGAVLRESMHPGHSTFVAKRKDVNTKEKRKIARKDFHRRAVENFSGKQPPNRRFFRNSPCELLKTRLKR